MGTNFYLRQNCCTECKRYDELHIGKSSMGWAFALHVIPEQDINSLEDWQRLWETEGNVIVDEYDRTITTEELMERITMRSGKAQRVGPCDDAHYGTWERFHVSNHSVADERGLLRRIVDGQYCTGHGDTWDLCPGEFS